MQLAWDEVKKALAPLFEDLSIPKYAQNAKFDCEILKRHGLPVRGLEVDTLIASYLIDPDSPHNLDDLSERYLSHKKISYKDVVATGKKEINFSAVALEAARDYSCEDADVTYRLAKILLKKLKEEKLEPLFWDIEMPLVSVLTAMELNGVKLDVP